MAEQEITMAGVEAGQNVETKDLGTMQDPADRAGTQGENSEQDLKQKDLVAGTELRNKRAICEYTGRAWETLLMLKKTARFPMEKIGRTWVSDTAEIDRWRILRLRRRE